jgi:dihydrolipoamide dehydrogenase
MKKSPKLIVVAAIVLLVAAWFALDFGQYFNLEYLKSQQAAIENWRAANPVKAVVIYSTIYIVVTALSLPGAVIMTLAGGALFGLLWGTVIISFASTIGATLAFIIARYLFHDWVQEKFGNRLQAINEGIRKEGAFYLFSLRLVPVFPFFVINLVMALTPIATRTYYWVSQLGMLPATIVFVYAGTQLAKIDSLQGLLSPGLLTAFILLGLFPLLAKKVVGFLEARKLTAKWSQPAHFDRNLIVIGAGAGGLVTAYIAAAVKARVTLVEKHKMGGDCLNTGCVPSKALIRTARLLSQMSRAEEFGISEAKAKFSFAEIMARVQRVIATIAPHDSVERYTRLGVEVIQGEARITSPWTVAIETEKGTVNLSTRSLVIATGARPFIPPITGIENIDYLTSDNLWNLQQLPQRLVVLGGGPIGCELAQSFARLGAQVTLIEMLPRILIREDEDVSAIVTERFQREGIEVLTQHKAVEFLSSSDGKSLRCEDLVKNDTAVLIPFDEVLVAVGRSANTKGFGLEALGIELERNGTIKTNAWLQTTYPNIYACGDVAGPYQFTHTAAHQAWYSAVNALFDPLKKYRVDYSVIPWATFTDPEVARVGLNETEAREKGIDFETTTYGIDDLDRAIADEEAHGFIKVLTVPGKDRILGVTIVGEHAGDLIAEYVLAMRQKIGLNKILGTIHIYPTLAEANKYVAGNWKKAHAPEKLLQWVERFHAWRRG